MNPVTYATLLRSQASTAQPIENMAGRIIRGQKPEDFLTLTGESTWQKRT
jgi:hypothetical protein